MLTFLIIFFSILFVVALFDIITIVCIAVNHDIDNVTPETKAIARKEAVSVVLGGVMAYCLVVIVMCL